jgi:phosphoglycerate dehydrogenase-like enzyme
MFIENASLRSGGWQSTLGSGLQGKTLGILGLGNVGAEAARRALAFGIDVIAWSENVTPELAKSHRARWVSKEELFRQSGYSDHPSGPQRPNARLGGAPELRLHMSRRVRERAKRFPQKSQLHQTETGPMMKLPARLVNTSGGPIIQEAALLEALREARIAGAMIDVFDIEPLLSFVSPVPRSSEHLLS